MFLKRQLRQRSLDGGLLTLACQQCHGSKALEERLVRGLFLHSVWRCFNDRPLSPDRIITIGTLAISDEVA
jgi:hypothetical protein